MSASPSVARWLEILGAQLVEAWVRGVERGIAAAAGVVGSVEPLDHEPVVSMCSIEPRGCLFQTWSELKQAHYLPIDANKMLVLDFNADL